MSCMLGGWCARRSGNWRLTLAGERYAQAPSTSTRRAGVLPVLVIPPCWRRAPEAYSEGTHPRNFLRSLGCSKRVRSPIAATIVTATVHGPPPQSLAGIDHGMSAPCFDL